MRTFLLLPIEQAAEGMSNMELRLLAPGMLHVGYIAGTTFPENENLSEVIEALPVSVGLGVQIMNASKYQLNHIETFCVGGILDNEVAGKKNKVMFNRRVTRSLYEKKNIF